MEKKLAAWLGLPILWLELAIFSRQAFFKAWLGLSLPIWDFVQRLGLPFWRLVPSLIHGDLNAIVQYIIRLFLRGLNMDSESLSYENSI